jgi:hypothetical protein
MARFSLFYSILTDSEAHSAFYPMGMRAKFSGGYVAMV